MFAQIVAHESTRRSDEQRQNLQRPDHRGYPAPGAREPVDRSALRSLLALLVLLMSLLAGCLEGAVEGTDAASDGFERPAVPRFGQPIFVGEGGSSLGEASLDVGSDGSMLVCSVSTNEVWASQDQASTWRTFAPFGDVRNGDCDVAVSDDGGWHVVFARWEGPAAERDLSLAVSRDQGATWQEHATTPPLGLTRHCPAPFGGCFAHRPWLHAAGGMLYLTYFNIQPAALFFQRSGDGGATWSEPILLDADPRAGISGDLSISEDGRVLDVPLVRGVPAGWDGEGVGIEDELRPWMAEYELATSTDGGVSWTTREVRGPLDVRFGFPSVARAGTGELYYAIPLFNGSRADLSISLSRDDGTTWSNPSVVAPGLDLRPGLAYMAMEASPDGGAVAAWHHWVTRNGSSGWAVDVARLDARSGALVEWTVEATEPAGHPGSIEFFQLRHDARGRIHVAYPVPEEACQGRTHRDCIYHVVAEAPSTA